MSCTRTLFAGTVVFALGVMASLGSIAEAKSRVAGARSPSAHKKLGDFVESGGCKIKASQDAVARMKEIASNGSVTWEGKCAGGLISGAGVLREEGITTTGGKARNVAHHWTGVAIKGIRSGKWKRESFARFVNSQRYLVNVSIVVFIDGLAKGPVTPVPISQLDDYSPSFRRIVADAQRVAEQANDGSHDSAEPKLAASTMLQAEVLKTELVVFTDSRGCKLWSSDSATERMKEIASHGAVTWQGVCKSGFISGTGVLREEGQTAIDGRTKKFAYFLSGTANKGVRTGQWKRESFEKFSDGPRFTADIATLEFVNGVAVGAPKPVAVTSWSQYSVNFSTRILAPALKEQLQSASASDSQSAAIVPDSPAAKRAEPVVSPEVTAPSPAAIPAPPAVIGTAQQQAASLPASPVTPPAKSVAPAPAAAVTAVLAPAPSPAPTPVPATAPAPAKAPVSTPVASSIFSLSALKSALSSVLGQAPTPAPAPASASASVPKRAPPKSGVTKITATSQHESYGAEGLFLAQQPGWHAATPIVFPQEVIVEFAAPVVFDRLGLLHQDRHPERAPRGYRVEVSMDGANWMPAGAASDACAPNTPDGWNEMTLPKAATGRFMKLVIFSNCGDPNLLTLRGLRLD